MQVMLLVSQTVWDKMFIVRTNDTFISIFWGVAYLQTSVRRRKRKSAAAAEEEQTISEASVSIKSKTSNDSDSNSDLQARENNEVFWGMWC